jgi:flagellar motility protein MotE (MotC chaperone)
MAAIDAAALLLKLGRAQAADILERMAPDDARRAQPAVGHRDR